MKVWQALLLILMLFVLLAYGTVKVFAQDQYLPLDDGPLIMQTDDFGNTLYQSPTRSGKINPLNDESFLQLDYTRMEMQNVIQGKTGQLRMQWQLPTREQPAGHSFCFQGIVPPAWSKGIGNGC